MAVGFLVLLFIAVIQNTYSILLVPSATSYCHGNDLCIGNHHSHLVLASLSYILRRERVGHANTAEAFVGTIVDANQP